MPPVDRVTELLVDVAFKVLTGLIEVTVLFGATEKAELRVRIEVVLEVGEDEDARPVADHPAEARVKGAVVLGKIAADELRALD